MTESVPPAATAGVASELRRRPHLSPAWGRWAPYALLGLVAFAVRLLPLLQGGGLGSYGRYDDGVYYAAADALTFGRVPYRDFVLLHPPMIMLVLAPFAALGRATCDLIGMEAARLAFMGIGALNTILVARIAHRWGRTAMIVAAAIYACWLPAVYGEESTLLEPVGTVLTLTALLLLLQVPRRGNRIRAQQVAGALLGASVTVKIWYAAPWLALVLWQLVTRGWRVSARVAAAGMAAAAVIVVPFLVLARGRMYDMVVRDQLLRPSRTGGRLHRLSSIFAVRSLLPVHIVGTAAATAMFLLLIVVALVGALWDRPARVLVLLVAVDLTVLVASPSYFGHYAELTAAPTALVVGVGGAFLVARVRIPRAGLALSVVTVMAMAASGARIASRPDGRPLAGARLAAAAPRGCVASDSPEPLILMNRLSEDLAHGCPLPVDVSGLSYDSLRQVSPTGQAVPRSRDLLWQRYLYDYLTSARSFVVIRGPGEISPSVYRRLVAHRVVATSHGVALRVGGRA